MFNSDREVIEFIRDALCYAIGNVEDHVPQSYQGAYMKGSAEQLVNVMNNYLDKTDIRKLMTKSAPESNDIITKEDHTTSIPEHYMHGDNIECLEAMYQEFGKDEVLAFCKLNAFKYLWRSEANDKVRPGK